MKCQDYITHVEIETTGQNWDNNIGDYVNTKQRRLVPKKGAILTEDTDSDGTPYVVLEYCYFGDGPSYRIDGQSYEELRALFTGFPNVPVSDQLPPGWQGDLKPDWGKAFPEIDPQEDPQKHLQTMEEVGVSTLTAAELLGKAPEPRG